MRGVDSTGSGYRTVAESWAQCTEPLDFINDQKFLDRQSDCHLSMRTRSSIKGVQDTRKCLSFCFETAYRAFCIHLQHITTKGTICLILDCIK